LKGIIMKITLIIFFYLLITGCSNGIKEIKSISEFEVPEWYLNEETNDEYIFGYGYGADINKQMSFEKAKTFAIHNINQKIEVLTKDKTISKSISDNLDSNNNMEIEITLQSSNSLNGLEIKRKGIFIRDKVYHSYVIIKYKKKVS
tara:strand:+ start:1705 stop:2142 length:438 start_codon:yes stop_codon:yes gene_type:complete